MKNKKTIRRYYRNLRFLHPTMSAVRAIRQARIWVNAGHMDIPFLYVWVEIELSGGKGGDGKEPSRPAGLKNPGGVPWLKIAPYDAVPRILKGSA